MTNRNWKTELMISQTEYTNNLLRMGNNHSKIKFECFLTMEERKLVTNFKAIRPKVYRNATARRQYANVELYNQLLAK